MSILGALYSAVSGLTANSNALGIISDNISNSNTVGYKEVSTNFSTLVTQANGATTLYSPGGVSSSPVYNVSQQGVMQSTNSPTDLAISGNGFFTVNNSPGGANSGGAFSFTRAGNFTVNATGDLVNAAGLYLQGQKLTPAQALAIANGNTQQLTATSLNSLQTVNVTGIGGTASATANVTLSANLPASDTATTSPRTMTVPIFDSQGNEHDMTLSFQRVATASSIQDFTPTGSSAQGDKITTTIDGNTYTTAPLTQSSPTNTNVANAINGQLNASVIQVGGGAPQAGDTFTATINNTSYTTAALSGAGPFTSSDIVNALNAKLTAIDVPVTLSTPATGDTYTVKINGTSYTTTGLAGAGPFTLSDIASAVQSAIPSQYTATVNGSNIEIQDTSGPLYQASIANNPMFTTGYAGINVPVSGTIAAGDTFTATINGTTYPPTGTTTALGASPTLADIATALQAVAPANTTVTADTTAGTIDFRSSTGAITAATINVSSGAETVGSSETSIDATQATSSFNAGQTFDVTVDGTNYGSTTALASGSANITGAAAAIQSLFTAQSAGFTASVVGGKIEITDPAGNPITASVTLSGGPGTESFGTGVQNTSFTASVNGSNINIADSSGNATTAVITSAGTGTETFSTQPSSNTYSATVVGGNIRLTDSSGNAMTGTAITSSGSETFSGGAITNGVPANRWSVTPSFPNSGTTTASILPGDNYVQFNNDGSLNLAASTFSAPDALSINWDPSVSGGQSPQTLTFDIGSNGQTNGLSQLGSTFSVGTINQDGVKFGNFTGVTVDQNGIVTANFNNGLHQAIYILPIATFANPDGLTPQTGDTYNQSAASGSVLLNQAGTGAAGTVSPSSLENSTVDIATEFSKLIVMQNAYQANSKVITVSDQMLQSLLNIQTG